MERVTVAMKMPMAVVANRCSAVVSRNSATEPSTGTPTSPRMTPCSEAATATSTTRPMDQTLASMISVGVTGMASRCSMVPCSRSRISAAPHSRMETMVTWLMSSDMVPNQPLSSVWLKRERSTSSTGAGAAVPR